MRNEISRTEGDGKQDREPISGLEGFPEEIRLAFDGLPKAIQKEVLSSTSGIEGEDNSEKSKRSLEDMVASFDTETREEFFSYCLDRVFQIGKLQNLLQSIDNEDLSKEITRLFDIFWQNRGKGEDMKIVNQEYYDSFFKARSVLEEHARNKRAEIDALELSITSTHKKIRETAKKTERLHSLKIDLSEIMNEIKIFDEKHQNAVIDKTYFRDVESRQKHEKEWTQAIGIVSEYMDPTEFATALSEQIDREFYNHKRILDNKTIFGKRISEDDRKNARAILEIVETAVEDWIGIHEEDRIYKDSKEVKSKERTQKTIDYLVSLIQSYSKSKKAGRSEEDMIYTTRQMGIAIKLLSRE